MSQQKINQKYYLTTGASKTQNLSVAPHWATGRCNPSNSTATVDAPSVFFYVVNALAHHISAWGSSVRQGVITGCFGQHTALSMVAQAGQLSSWPVSVEAGIATPIWATTLQERCNSGGSKFCYSTEIIIMMATPIQSHSQFIWLFLAVRRSDASARPHREEVTAPTYQAARRVIAREFIASFAGRLPAREVAHV